MKNSRKEREGVVLSNKMQKTVVVSVVHSFKHPDFDKRIARTKKFYAHTESNDLQVGQKVTLVETRPLSKLKRWRVVEK